MKKNLYFQMMSLLLALFLAGCNDKPDHDLIGKFNAHPIAKVIVDGAVVEFDEELREINLVYSKPQDFSNISVELELENGVKMVSPTSNPFSIDLSDGAEKQITVWSYDRNMTYKIRASVSIDVSEPITEFKASANGHDATVNIDHENRSISVEFDYNVDLSNITVDYTLAQDVEAVSPTGKAWDLTEPITFKLKKFTMESNYRVTASVNIDMSEPFTEFSAIAEDSFIAKVTVDHKARTIGLAFDGYQIDLSNVAVTYALANEVTAISPSGNTWTLAEGVPTEFKLEKRGLEVVYTVTTTVTIDVSQPILTFTASSGSENATVVFDNSARTISLIFEQAADLTNVNVEYTLAENVTVTSPAEKTWDLSNATKENPFEFKIHKLGMDITYKVYPTKFFVPEFRDEKGNPATVPADWVRITESISPDIAFYKVPQWNGHGTIEAYAIAVQANKIDFRTIGDGYDKMKSLPLLAPRAPEANFIINGSDKRALLVMDGKIINNVEGPDGNYSILIDQNGQMHQFAGTNRLGSDGIPCAAGTPGEHFVNDIYWWDTKALYPGITYSGNIGSGYLNWGAKEIPDAGHPSGFLFPNGILNGANKETKMAMTCYGTNGDRSQFFFFVCEMSSRSVGITQQDGLEIIRNMGANDGTADCVNNMNAVGLYVNGKSMIEAANGGEHSTIGYAFTITAK